MTIFKLLHISDLHFSAKPNHQGFIEMNSAIEMVDGLTSGSLSFQTSHCTEVSQVLAQQVHYLTNDTDILIVSGDLGTTGRKQDLEESFQFLFASPLPAWDYLTAYEKPTLNASNRDIVLMPGNHDRFMGVHALPGCKNFEFVFANSWEPKEGVIADVFSDPSGEALAVICADFSLRSWLDASPKRYFPGQGRAYPDVVEKLEITTSLIREERGCPVIWVTHFPATRVCEEYRIQEHLNDFHRVVDAAKRNDVKYILSGHIHKSHVFDHDGLSVICTGSGCAYKRCMPANNSFNFLTFHVSGLNLALANVSIFKYGRGTFSTVSGGL